MVEVQSGAPFWGGLLCPPLTIGGEMKLKSYTIVEEAIEGGIRSALLNDVNIRDDEGCIDFATEKILSRIMLHLSEIIKWEELE